MIAGRQRRTAKGCIHSVRDRRIGVRTDPYPLSQLTTPSLLA